MTAVPVHPTAFTGIILKFTHWMRCLRIARRLVRMELEKAMQGHSAGVWQGELVGRYKRR